MRGSNHRIQLGHEIAVMGKLGRLAYRAGAMVRLGLAKLVTSMTHLVRFAARAAPAGATAAHRLAPSGPL
jgi:hypothetical protein